MVKFLKNQDVQVTNFAVAKSKVSNTLFYDLLLANDEEYSFPLAIPIEECNYNFNSTNVTGSFNTIVDGCNSTIINESGFLACSPNLNENNPTTQIGKKYISDIPFYPSGSIYYDPEVNPINEDGTYQGQVYNTVKNMYYNNYNNSYNMFGIDGYSTENVKLNLQDKFTVYSFHVTQSGDKIRPLSINIQNQTGDIIADIKDDGNYNLYLSGSYFVNNFELSTTNKDNVVNYCEYGLGKYLCDGEFKKC